MTSMNEAVWKAGLETIDLPPVVRELFALLPKPNTEWPLQERLRWLRAAEATFQMIYKDDGPPIVFEKAGGSGICINAIPTPGPDN